MILLFFPRNQSTRGVKSAEDASAAAGTGKVGLADWESARPTRALADTIAVGAVGLADSGQAPWPTGHSAELTQGRP
jgi:hypothetical protein